jgi:hypothetical protein
LRRLHEAGFDCRAEDDFAEIPDHVAATGKPFQSPMFSILRNDFTKGTAFWAFLMQDSARVGGLAAQFYDLREERLDQYLIRTAASQYGGGQRAIEWVAPPVGEVIGGKLIYFGELYFGEEVRGKRRVLTAFARLSMILAAMTWPQFDWMYAFIPKSQARFADYYGFTYRLPYSIRWTPNEPFGRGNDHMIVAISSRDLAHVLACGDFSEF